LKHGNRVLSGFVQKPNPKSLVGELSRLWHRVKVDSGIGLPVVNVLESTLEWTYKVRL
jgi:hypothetical protein